MASRQVTESVDVGSTPSEPMSYRILVTLLGATLASTLFARLISVPVTPLVVVVSTVCVYAVTRDRRPAITGTVTPVSWKVTGCYLAPFVALELLRLIREENTGGFAVQIASLGAEDSAAWLRISGGFQSQSDYLTWQGVGVVLLLAVASGIFRLTQFIHGQTYGTIGFSTLTVAGAFSLLTLWVPLLMLAMHRRLRGLATGTRAVVVGSAGIVLLDFVGEAREMGHLTAALSAMALATLLVTLPSMSTETTSRRWELPRLLVALIGISTLWLPFGAIGVVSLVSLVWLMVRRAPKAVLVVGVLGSVSIIWTLFRYSLENAEKLFVAPGGTQTVSTALLIATVVLIGAVVVLDRDALRLHGLLIVGIAVGSVLIGDAAFNDVMGYGATKMLWVVAPVIFVVTACELAGAPLFSRMKKLGKGLGVTFGLVAFLTGSAQSLAAQVTGIAGVDHESTAEVPADVKRWDNGYLLANRELDEVPAACIIQDQFHGTFKPGWEGYLCSRFLGWSAEMSECPLGLSCDEVFEPYRFSGPFRSYGVNERSIAELLAMSAVSDIDPTRTVLVLNDEGLVLDEVTIAEFLRKLLPN